MNLKIVIGIGIVIMITGILLIIFMRKGEHFPSQNCKILPQCPAQGSLACCPEDWEHKPDSAQCVDSQGKAQCCLDVTPSASDYSTCITTYPPCHTLNNVWRKGDLAEATNDPSCNSGITGPDVSITPEYLGLSNFNIGCWSKNVGEKCFWTNGSSSYNGTCKECDITKQLKCFPEQMCVATSNKAGYTGVCSKENICHF